MKIKENQLKEQGMTREKSKKLVKIILFILLLILIVVSIIIYLNSKKVLITYNKKYIEDSGENWVEFYSDGKCNRNIESVSCVYEVEDKIITLKEIQDVYGTSIEVEMHYKIINEEELEHIFTCFPQNTNTNSPFNCNSDSNISNKYSINNKLVDTQEDKEEEKEEESSVSEKIIDTKMLHIEDNYYYVCYSNDSLERVLFGFRESGTYKVVYSKLKMSISSAKYETVKEVEGNYYADNNYIYMGNVTSPIIFGPSAGVQTQVFNFAGLECTVKSSNSNEDNSESYDSETETTNNVSKTTTTKKITEDKNSSTSGNSNSSNNNSTYEERSQASKENLDKVTVELKHNKDNYYSVKINYLTNNFEVEIEGKNYTYSPDDIISLTYEKNGSNCINIKLTDEYNNIRTLNECIDFTADAPNYTTWLYDLAPNGVCDIRLKQVDGENYNSENLTCSVGDNNFNCNDGYRINVKFGTYPLIITNQYGISQTTSFSCNPRY